MDRSAEFRAILHELKRDETGSGERKSLLTEANGASANEASPFFNHFLSECSLMNTTLLQLSKEFTALANKPETFSFTTPSVASSDEKIASLERALDVCGASLSLLQAKCEEKRVSEEPERGFFKTLFSAKEEARGRDALLLEHCELVGKFLKGRMCRLTERIEVYKQRKQSRTSTVLRQRNITSTSAKTTTTTTPMTTTTTLSSLSSTAQPEGDALQIQLQLENSQLTSQLFSDLATTETAILHIARLQTTLQSHLEMQHDLTCRLFEESEQVDGELDRGNKYLKRAAQDSSMGRKILVALMLGASVILLLLHFLKQ